MKRRKGSPEIFGLILIAIIAISSIVILHAIPLTAKRIFVKSDVETFVEANDQATKLVSVLKTKTGDMTYGEIFACMASGLECGLDENELTAIIDQMNTKIMLYGKGGAVKSYGTRTSGDMLRAEIPVPGGGSVPIGILIDIQSTMPVETNAGGAGWIWPISTEDPITVGECFGDKRTSKTTNLPYTHVGIDLPGSKGDPIYAVESGTVEYICTGAKEGAIKKEDKTCNGYGNHVLIKHGNYYVRYCHLDSIPEGIKKGERVSQGEVIGYMGNTGYSFGVHLHFEVHSKDPLVYGTKADIDPLCMYTEDYLDNVVKIHYYYTPTDNDCDPSLRVCNTVSSMSYQSETEEGL